MTDRPRGSGLFIVGTILVLCLAGCDVQSNAASIPEPLTIHSEAATLEPIVVWSEEPIVEAAIESVAQPRIETPSATGGTPVPGAAPPMSSPKNGTVLAQLETIEVKGRAPKTGYDRSLFGAGWKDPDGNGCDARNDVLGRDLQNATAKPGTRGCVIISGILQDPFTGQRIDFVRGQGTSTKVQIDHIVALSDAWQKGAQQMSAQERLVFANDPLNLLAADGPTNASKGDGDSATWLPPDKGFRCDYVARQTAVKAKHGLWMTKAERGAIHSVITSQCPGMKALATAD